jgi:hypothetical protein
MLAIYTFLCLGTSSLPTGGLFGSTAKPAENVQATSSGTTAPSGGLFGGGNPFAKKPEQSAPSTSTPAATTAAPAFGSKDSAPATDGASSAPAGKSYP